MKPNADAWKEFTNDLIAVAIIIGERLAEAIETATRGIIERLKPRRLPFTELDTPSCCHCKRHRKETAVERVISRRSIFSAR